MAQMIPLPKRLSVGQALALGTLTVGVLDLLDAVIFFGLRGVPATAILQSIASGLLGPAAFDGGAATARSLLVSSDPWHRGTLSLSASRWVGRSPWEP